MASTKGKIDLSTRADNDVDFQTLEKVNPAEAVSRERWLDVAVYALIKSVTRDTLYLMAGGGEDKFINITRKVWKRHGFTHKEYQRAYAMVRRAAKAAQIRQVYS